MGDNVSWDGWAQNGGWGENHKEMQIIYLALGKNFQLFKSSEKVKNTWGIFFVLWMYHKKSY